MAVLDTAAALAAVSAPLGAARGLPNPCYTDAECHRLEARALFARNWTCVGAGADIPEPGDALPVEAAGAPILLVRGRDGAVRAFHNVCRHRGARLVLEPEKRRPALRCPYHSWTYGLDGELLRTPLVGGPGHDDCPAVDKSGLGLRPVRAAVWNDLVFVDLSGAAPPLAETTGPLDARWADYDFSDMRHVASWELEVRANWKLAVENFLESYHLPWVHPALTARSPLEEHRQVAVSDRVYGQTTDSFAPDKVAESPFAPFPGLSPARELTGEYPIVFPNVLLGLQRDHFYAIIVDPLAPDRTRERVRLYMVGERPDRPGYDEALAALVANWKEVFAEDVWAVERLQMGRASDAFDGGVLTPRHDALTQRFMRTVAECLAEGAEDGEAR